MGRFRAIAAVHNADVKLSQVYFIVVPRGLALPFIMFAAVVVEWPHVNRRHRVVDVARGLATTSEMKMVESCRETRDQRVVSRAGVEFACAECVESPRKTRLPWLLAGRCFDSCYG